MLTKALLFLSIAMMMGLVAQAQQADEQIVWSKAGQLPQKSEQKPHAGLAGAFVGIHNDILLMAGGATFPDKMPWEGGKKVFYNEIFAFKQTKNGLENLPNSVQLLPITVSMLNGDPKLTQTTGY